MKKKRLDTIINIIRVHEVETQDELISYLRAEGFEVTQATVSRDIRELKLTKIMTGRGNYRYILPDNAFESKGLRLSHALSEAITRAASAENRVVVHTFPGMAQAVALEIDHLGHAGILGTVAGDDTIFIVTTDRQNALTVREEIKELIRSRSAKKGEA